MPVRDSAVNVVLQTLKDVKSNMVDQKWCYHVSTLQDILKGQYGRSLWVQNITAQLNIKKAESIAKWIKRSYIKTDLLAFLHSNSLTDWTRL